MAVFNSTSADPRPISVIFFIATLAFFTLITAASAGSGAVPANATARSWGYGWECQTGYIEDGDVCQAINKPANAVLSGSSFGKGWSCLRGFREDGDQCKKVAVPSNAFLKESTYGGRAGNVSAAL